MFMSYLKKSLIIQFADLSDMQSEESVVTPGYPGTLYIFVTQNLHIEARFIISHK